MEVICNGHKTCVYVDTCHHSKPHEVVLDGTTGGDKNPTIECWLSDNDDHKFICQCGSKTLRKYKLEKLNKL